MELATIDPGSTTISADNLERLRVELVRRLDFAAVQHMLREADIDQRGVDFEIDVVFEGQRYSCGLEAVSELVGGGSRGYLVAETGDCSNVFCYKCTMREDGESLTIQDIELVQKHAVVIMDPCSNVGDATCIAAPYLLGLLKFQPKLCYAGG